jgi:hypothetical protein
LDLEGSLPTSIVLRLGRETLRYYSRFRHITIGPLLAAIVLTQSSSAAAQDSAVLTAQPSSVFGLTYGTLMPQNTFEAFVGSHQPPERPSFGSTGLQVYYGGLRYRGSGLLEFGANLTVFDDPPENNINGSLDTLTYVGAGADLKYQFYKRDRLSAAVVAGVEAIYYSRGEGLATQSELPDSEKDTVVSATISVPVTYQISWPLSITGEIGYTHAASTVVGRRGFGGRAFVSGGLTYQASPRISYYGALKLLARDINDGIDAQDQGGSDYIYTLGARFALTPQAAANFYVTNAFSASATGDDLLFFPAKKDPVIGLLLSYRPSGRGTRDSAETFRTANRVGEGLSRFSDGHTIIAPNTLAADRFHTRLSYGSAGQTALAFYYAPDPDIQLEVSLENYALEDGSNFRSEDLEDPRFMIGGRWQAMDEAYEQPFNLSFGLAASRDIKNPSVGSLIVQASASKTYANSSLTLNARSAIYGNETLVGAGVMYSYDFSDKTTAIGEYTFTRDDDPVWSVGLRHSPRKSPFSIDIYSTNASGQYGLGSLLSNDAAQFGISLSWRGSLDLF